MGFRWRREAVEVELAATIAIWCSGSCVVKYPEKRHARARLRKTDRQNRRHTMSVCLSRRRIHKKTPARNYAQRYLLQEEISSKGDKAGSLTEAPRLRKLGRSTSPSSVSRLSMPCQQVVLLLALRPGYRCCTSQYVCRAG